MNRQTKTNKIANSFFWKLFERGAAQIITIIVQIILARILAPEDFGTLAIILVFIDFANIFIQRGFSSALIRKKEATDLDYNTCLMASEGIAIICIVIIYFSSPFIESFYQTEQLSNYLRVLSISLVFAALYSIENAILVRQMKFRLIFIRSILASIGAGMIGILTAIQGAGIWALVFQSLAQQIILCVATSFGCNWKPRLEFSKKSFYEIFSYGSKILWAEIIAIGMEHIRTLAIGKAYSASKLAFYDRGQYYPAAIMRSIYDSIQSVLLPVFSREQDNKKRLASEIELSLSISTFLVFPIFIGFAAISNEFVVLFLSDQWIPSIPYLKLFCFYQLTFPIYGILKQSLCAIGKSDAVLKLEAIRGAIFLIAIVVSIQMDIFAVAIATTIAIYLTTLVFGIYVHYYMRFSVKKIAKNVILSLMQCLAMYGIIQIANQSSCSALCQIIIDIVIGIFVYCSLSVVLKNKTFFLLYDYLKGIVKFKNQMKQ